MYIFPHTLKITAFLHPRKVLNGYFIAGSRLKLYFIEENIFGSFFALIVKLILQPILINQALPRKEI